MPFAGPSSGGYNCRTCEGYVTDQPDGASVGCEETLDDTYIIGEDVVGYTLPAGCELAGAPESPAQLRAAWCTYCGDDNKTHLVIHVQIWLNLSEENFFLRMMQNLEYVLEGVGEANLTQEHDITNQGGERGLEDVDGDGAADFSTGQLQDRHGFDCNTGLFPAPNSIWTYRDGGDAEWSNMGVDVACGCSGPCDGENPCPEGCVCVGGECVACDVPPHTWFVGPLDTLYVDCFDGGGPGTEADADAFTAAYIDDANEFAGWLQANGWGDATAYESRTLGAIFEGFEGGPCNGNDYKVFENAVSVNAKCCGGGQSEESRTCDFFQGAPRTPEAVGFNFNGELVDAADLYYGCGNPLP